MDTRAGQKEQGMSRAEGSASEMCIIKTGQKEQEEMQPSKLNCTLDKKHKKNPDFFCKVIRNPQKSHLIIENLKQSQVVRCNLNKFTASEMCGVKEGQRELNIAEFVVVNKTVQKQSIQKPSVRYILISKNL